MSADIVKLPAGDPVFALAPGLELRRSTIDGELVVNSRDVACVFLRDDHPALIRRIMWSISRDRSVWPQWHDEFRMCADGTIDLTFTGLAVGAQPLGLRVPRDRAPSRIQSCLAQTGLRHDA
jgi:hypothetical protein